MRGAHLRRNPVESMQAETPAVPTRIERTEPDVYPQVRVGGSVTVGAAETAP